MGQELATEFEKTIKLVTDAKTLERLDRIGQALAAVAKTQQIPADYGTPDLADYPYEFKIIKGDDINAISLPGGIIYVYSGLLDFAESDDELAGVLAHEVAHTAHHHVMALMRKQSKMDIVIALIAVAGGLGKMKGQDLTNVLYGAQSVRTARLSGLGQQAENDADKTGAALAYKAGYDPRGILRFLDRLNQYQEKRGEIRNLGIFQTHPASVERTVRIARQCAAMGVEVDLREAAHLAKAESEKQVVDGRELWTVKIAGKVFCTVVDADGLSAEERAERTCKALNMLLHSGLRSKEISLNERSSELAARGETILKLTRSDCDASGMERKAILLRAADAIRYALWSDRVKSEQ